MGNFDWQDHLSEEYGGDVEEILSEGAGALTGEIDSEGRIRVTLGSVALVDYFLQLPEKFHSSLRLLSEGAKTPEESYRLSQLLRCLKQRRDVQGGSRREFLAALQDQEAVLANRLRMRLEAEKNKK